MLTRWSYWKVRDCDWRAIQTVLELGAEPFAVSAGFVYFKRQNDDA